LQDLYKPQHQKYGESYFNEIVKNCKLGKNKAGKYLKLLEEKGLVHKRTDGYRVWYAISNDVNSHKILNLTNEK